jgi:hypothetical protein
MSQTKAFVYNIIIKARSTTQRIDEEFVVAEAIVAALHIVILIMEIGFGYVILERRCALYKLCRRLILSIQQELGLLHSFTIVHVKRASQFNKS